MSQPERPVLRYFGGKWELAPWIISHFPEHHAYVEPFGGGGSVLMRKPRAHTEVYNDLDGGVVNVFRCLRDCPQKLFESLALTPFSREEFDRFNSIDATTSPLESARLTIYRTFSGFGGSLAMNTGFRANTQAAGKAIANVWAEYPNHVAAFAERLRGVVIENRDALEVIDQQDGERTLFYVDPPYIAESRTIQSGYRCETSDEMHLKLVERLKTVKGFVILSGYETPVYASLGWHRVETEALTDSAQGRKAAKTEVLWLNPACAGAQSQQRLF